MNEFEKILNQLIEKQENFDIKKCRKKFTETIEENPILKEIFGIGSLLRYEKDQSINDLRNELVKKKLNYNDFMGVVAEKLVERNELAFLFKISLEKDFDKKNHTQQFQFFCGKFPDKVCKDIRPIQYFLEGRTKNPKEDIKNALSIWLGYDSYFDFCNKKQNYNLQQNEVRSFPEKKQEEEEAIREVLRKIKGNFYTYFKPLDGGGLSRYKCQITEDRILYPTLRDGVLISEVKDMEYNKLNHQLIIKLKNVDEGATFTIHISTFYIEYKPTIIFSSFSSIQYRRNLFSGTQIFCKEDKIDFEKMNIESYTSIQSVKDEISKTMFDYFVSLETRNLEITCYKIENFQQYVKKEIEKLPLLVPTKIVNYQSLKEILQLLKGNYFVYYKDYLRSDFLLNQGVCTIYEDRLEYQSFYEDHGICVGSLEDITFNPDYSNIEVKFKSQKSNYSFTFRICTYHRGKNFSLLAGNCCGVISHEKYLAGIELFYKVNENNTMQMAQYSLREEIPIEDVVSQTMFDYFKYIDKGSLTFSVWDFNTFKSLVESEMKKLPQLLPAKTLDYEPIKSVLRLLSGSYYACFKSKSGYIIRNKLKISENKILYKGLDIGIYNINLCDFIYDKRKCCLTINFFNEESENRFQGSLYTMYVDLQPDILFISYCSIEETKTAFSGIEIFYKVDEDFDKMETKLYSLQNVPESNTIERTMFNYLMYLQSNSLDIYFRTYSEFNVYVESEMKKLPQLVPAKTIDYEDIKAVLRLLAGNFYAYFIATNTPNILRCKFQITEDAAIYVLPKGSIIEASLENMSFIPTKDSLVMFLESSITKESFYLSINTFYSRLNFEMLSSSFSNTMFKESNSGTEFLYRTNEDFETMSNKTLTLDNLEEHEKSIFNFYRYLDSRNLRSFLTLEDFDKFVESEMQTRGILPA